MNSESSGLANVASAVWHELSRLCPDTNPWALTEPSYPVPQSGRAHSTASAWNTGPFLPCTKFPPAHSCPSQEFTTPTIHLTPPTWLLCHWTPGSPNSFKSICLVPPTQPPGHKLLGARAQVLCIQACPAQCLAVSPVFTTNQLRRKEKGIPWGRGESRKGREGLPPPWVPHPRADHRAQAGPGHFSLLGTRGGQQPLF